MTASKLGAALVLAVEWQQGAMALRAWAVLPDRCPAQPDYHQLHPHLQSMFQLIAWLYRNRLLALMMSGGVKPLPQEGHWDYRGRTLDRYPHLVLLRGPQSLPDDQERLDHLARQAPLPDDRERLDRRATRDYLVHQVPLLDDRERLDH
ncbi:MAG: hypothetical protein JXB07_10885, partial [Anaerolineae bacterium]|nr:hypothetical protein [Anaerolineae bacterium]